MTDAQRGRRIKAEGRIQHLSDRVLKSIQRYGGTPALKKAAARVLARRSEQANEDE
jgi:hypothetical protein